MAVLEANAPARQAPASEQPAHSPTQPEQLTFTVRGLPGPQGSKSFKGFSADGHAVLVESSAKVKPWRQDVVAAAIQAVRATPGFRAFDAPVELLIEFYLPRPKGDPKSRRTVPAKTPDLSKLIRATEDAITTAGVWRDDALVVDMVVRKRYALLDPELGHQWELPGPGAVVTIRAVDAASTWADRPLEQVHHARVPSLLPQVAAAGPLIASNVNPPEWEGNSVVVPQSMTDAKAAKAVATAGREARKHVTALIIEAGVARLSSYTGQPLSTLQRAVLDAVANAKDDQLVLVLAQEFTRQEEETETAKGPRASAPESPISDAEW